MTKLSDILYIEDDPDIQEIAQLTLEKIGGYQVRLSSSCAEALELLKTYMPQLILLDVMMPGQDGPTTLSILQSFPQIKDVPVVFVTAKVQKHEVDSYMAMGASGVISKPFDPMSLSSIIEGLWQDHITKPL